MPRAGSRASPGLPRLCWLACSLCAGMPLLALGCANPIWRLQEDGPPVPPPALTASPPAPAQTTATARPVAPAPARTGVIQASHHEGAPAPPAVAREVPISLDSVLHLTEDQNAQIAVAREKVGESLIEQQLACDSCLPHPAKCVKARGNVWQQKGELSKVTNDNLLEAANTYIDLLTARRAEAVAREVEKLEVKAVGRAEALYNQGQEPAARVLVEGGRATLDARRQSIAKLRQQGDAAAAKLAYLLGLGPDCCLVPVDVLAPIDLVDVSPPVCDLIDKALANGPGVRELQGLLDVIEAGIEQASNGLGHCLPGVQGKVQVAHSKLTQTELSYKDLRGRLTTGVQEAREAIVAGRVQIGLGGEWIKHAAETYRLSDLRVGNVRPEEITGSISEVMQSARGLWDAHLGYLQAVGAYDKAQIRLLLLLGPANACKTPPPAPPDHP